MVEILLSLLLAAHLLLVDVVMAGPLVCVWLEWRETSKGDIAAGTTGRALASALLWAFAAAVAIGVALLAIRWNDRSYFAALSVIPNSRFWFGLGELGFYFVCMVAYRVLWGRLRGWSSIHRLLAIAAALNLLAHFPALFAIISVASTRPPLWSETLDRAGYWRLLLDPEVLSRVVHVWLAAFAVTGVALMILAKRLARGETNRESYDRLMRRGGWIALASTLLEIPSGLWLAFEMPEHARGALLGNDLWTSGLFAAALVMVFQLLHTLAAVALGDSNPRLAGRSAAITVLVVILMSTTRARLDDRAMAGHEGAALRAACDSGFAPADGRGLASRKS